MSLSSTTLSIALCHRTMDQPPTPGNFIDVLILDCGIDNLKAIYGGRDVVSSVYRIRIPRV